MTAATAGAPTQLGHLALRVRDLDKSIAFYTEVLGLKLKMKTRGPAFLGIREDASHELALMPIAADAEGPDPSRAGLYHFAWEMGSFEALQALHNRLIEKGATIAGYSPATDSANVMFFDPDGNEIEAIWEPLGEELARLKAAGPMPKLKHD
jgi:catechol 2,3-dioxygenase